MHRAGSPKPAPPPRRPAALLGRWLVAVMVVMLGGWVFMNKRASPPDIEPQFEPSRSEQKTAAPAELPGDRILAGYGDPQTTPIEDLRKIHRVLTGYFTVVKNPSRFPIGGNADLAAALRGENAAGEVFVSADHPAFSQEGLLLDRWGHPLVVHPEAWREIELRSAGPDGIPYNQDDLILAPNGSSLKPDR